VQQAEQVQPNRDRAARAHTHDAPHCSVATPANPKPIGSSANDPRLSMVATRPSLSPGASSCSVLVQTTPNASNAAPFAAAASSSTP
jgi:hypothetical protein